MMIYPTPHSQPRRVEDISFYLIIAFSLVVYVYVQLHSNADR